MNQVQDRFYLFFSYFDVFSVSLNAHTHTIRFHKNPNPSENYLWVHISEKSHLNEKVYTDFSITKESEARIFYR